MTNESLEQANRIKKALDDAGLIMQTLYAMV